VRWPTSIDEAREIQETLRKRLKVIPLRETPKYIAAVDAAFSGDRIVAVACLYSYPDITIEEERYAVKKASFPYIPGYLSFREGPAIVNALKNLKIKPDLILFDGQGIAHPRGLGIASHIGVLLDIPSIGCAKSRLVGDYKEPGCKKGDWSPLNYKGIVVGAVLRTKDCVRPLFVSPGHRTDLKGSIEIVLGCMGKYRIPEPLRRADLMSKRIKRGYS
jgi:deoxyribonuclease V